MHPQRELNRLTIRKAALQRTIALRRVRCAEAAARVVSPLEWVDRMTGLWGQGLPFAEIVIQSLGLFSCRSARGRPGFAGRLVRWGSHAAGTASSLGLLVARLFGSD